jgi:hypothetical protein
MSRLLPALALLLVGCHARETNDQQLTRLQGERAALGRAIAKDTKALYRAQPHYTSARRRHNAAALRRLRGPMYELHARIEAAKEKAVELGQRIAMLEGEREAVTGGAP